MADQPMATEEDVREALKVVKDPEIGIDIVNLGMVYGIDVMEDGKVRIDLTLTTMGCPIFDWLANQMRTEVQALPGITDVDVQLVWSPPWSPDKMSDDAKAMMRYMF